MSTNFFFYSINVNDRVRFPILGEMKKDPTPDDTTSMELDTNLSEDFPDEISQKIFNTIKQEEDSYFGAFKQTNCEKGLYCDEILKFLEGFFKRPRLGASPWRSLQAFLNSFSTYVHSNTNEFRELMDTMNTKRLITPYMELDLPANIVQEFNQLEQGDPRIHLYQLNPVWGPAIKEFGFFWERYESTKEVLCMFIWSTIDQTVVPIPAVGLNPYPLCWVCDKGFGTLACTRCQVAKYCSKECQQQDWIRHGGPICDLMASCLRRVKQLTFKRPPSPHIPTPPATSSTPSSSSSTLASTSPVSTTSIPSSHSKHPTNHKSSRNQPSNHSSASSSSSRSPTSTPSISPSTSPSPSPSPPLSSDEFFIEDPDPPFSYEEYI